MHISRTPYIPSQTLNRFIHTFLAILCLLLASPFSATAQSTTRFVGYLPDYDGSYASYATSINFTKMTHLYLAFANPPFCSGTCTASSDMTFAIGQSDADIAKLVNAAHAAGVKVILSIGGGGGDQQILQFYNAGLSTQLASSLNTYVSQHNLDGVDLDIEDPNNMGQPFQAFTQALINTFHPQGKVVTAAVAEYLQASMPDAALHMFDWINIMVYSNYSDSQDALNYYVNQKQVPANQALLGIGLFGSSPDGSIEEPYSTILAAYPNAWQTDSVSGGSLDGGTTLNYTGVATTTDEAQLAAQYGGVMVWELSQDVTGSRSLLAAIRNAIH